LPYKEVNMTAQKTAEAGALNTDRELWRGPDEGNGGFYADSILITKSGGIGINCCGYVIVKSLKDWHELARKGATPTPADVAGLVRRVWEGLLARCASTPRHEWDKVTGLVKVSKTDFVAAITPLIETLARREKEARAMALEEAARVAEIWEPIEKLLPLCNADQNECAMTGQWEARERIADAIRALTEAKAGETKP
jgi:hypothetical protein